MNSSAPHVAALLLPLDIDVQLACNASNTPAHEQFETWIQATLHATEFAHTDTDTPIELCIRLVDKKESQALNAEYRNKDYPTNVLSFPMDMPEDIPEVYLGDLVICADVVAEESDQQSKPLSHHWAHLTVHGTLHLLGFDHIETDQADAMEALETRILASFGIADPYAYPDNEKEANQIAS